MNYLWDERFRLFRRDVVEEFPYSDGVEFESRLLEIVTTVSDRGTFSPEIAQAITDWPSEYHFSRSRHCLVRPLGITAGDKVLELGCGCGAVTRFLGETGAEVVAVEASLLRARIAAERCRDLGNVRIIVDNLTKFHTDQQFDYVLFIGVLEYAAVFSDGANPFVDQLRSAAQLLARGGRVVVAIENQLGLKYLNGCSEDHVGIPFFGVQDLYAKNSVRTFGRQQLKTKLTAAGLPHLRFYYPFPDYKLPSVILSEEALTDPDLDLVDLLARCHARDYTGRPFRSFDESLVFSVAHKNGVLADLSNSFLVVAMADAPHADEQPALARAYSVNREAQFATQTTMLRQGSGLVVTKQPLLPVSGPRLVHAAGMKFVLSCSDSAYVSGRQLLWKLLRARVSSAGPEPIYQALQPWFRYVLGRAQSLPEASPSDLASYVLPGHMLDCTPFNLIEVGDELILIDVEWLTEDRIPAGWVITRGLLYSLQAGSAPARNLQSLLAVLAALCSEHGLLVTPEDIQSWLAQEADFQAVVNSRPPARIDIEVTTGTRSALVEIASLNQEMREVVAARDREFESKNEYISRIEDDIRRKDQCISEIEDDIRRKDQCISEIEQNLRRANESIGELIRLQAKLTGEHENTKTQLRNLRVEFEQIVQSRSWRYTAIVRQLARRVLRLGAEGSQASRQLQQERQVVTDSGLFDAAWYLARNPDVATAGFDPLTHFLRHGAAELRDPGPSFCTRWYLEQNPDVQASGLNPLVHYARFGAPEGRRPAPGPDRGASANPTSPQWQITSSALIRRAQQEWERSGGDRLRAILSSEAVVEVPRAADPPVSIVMALHNKAHLSLLSIESLLAHADVPFELVLVNNASQDETAELLERIIGATVLANTANVGFGVACTQAAKVATSKVLCFFNNDALLLPKSLGVVLEQFRSDPGIGAVGGKVLLADGSLQEAGSIIWSDGSALGYGRGDDPRLPQYCFRRPVDYCSATFLFTPTELFRSLGGFDEEFAPAYYEDADYCMRVWQSGLRVVYEPQAVIRHYESASSGGNEAAKDLMAQQQKKFVGKWHAALAAHDRPETSNVVRARIATQFRGLRIVYIDDRIPHRHLGSGFCRSNYIVNQLAQMGHCVTCVSLSVPLGGCEQEYVDIRTDIELLDGVSCRESLLHDYLPQCDITWISRPHNLQTFLSWQDQGAGEKRFRVVYDAEAIFAERKQLEAKLRHEVGEDSALADLQNETELAKLADAVVVVSEKDQATMLAAAVADVSVIGHQIAPTPTPSAFEQRHSLLFVGAMHGSDNPNADSMRFFCRSIWPAVRRAIGATLVIVGYGTDAAVSDLGTEGIQVLGARGDLTPLYNDARIFIVPTRYAAGLPYKAHEAAAHGVPMVVSDVIARQLDWRDGEDYLAASDPHLFAASCIRLYRDRGLWDKLRWNALKRVKAELDESRSAETLSALIARVTGNHRTVSVR
ncbi:MAG TPA: glycosyltransferase [Terriglobales bacterium]|nr:glycosyltransferase [Terriglobales bacterium]